ncbi:Cytochrome P450 family protein [Ceratobasidium theobromae]|uniref:Cytochrome P450 family protein n=1 Tax=Ceratobasidium theobromae TaxID=1582974 RepID=A0A5N5QET1_9AGAM|nr:Cytochrome P450 family protein [Ceratobasidium theobromae]
MISAAAIIVACLVSYLALKKRRNTLPLPPGPPPLFLLGNALEVGKARYLWLKLDEYARSYGGIITFRLLSRPVVVLSDPNIVNELLEKRSANFSTRPPVMMAKLAGWGESILFTPYGQRLRTYRKLLHHTFNPRATLDFQDLQIDEVRKLMKRLVREPKAFLKHVRLMAGSIAIRIAYGYPVRDPNDKFIRSAEEFMGAVSEGARVQYPVAGSSSPFLRFVPSWFPGATFKRKAEEWGKMTIGYRQAPFDFVLKSMTEGTAVPSFTSKLLEPEDGSQVSAEENNLIKIVASNLYGAGGDTTASLLESFFLAMTLYPQVQAKAQAEIDAYLKSVSASNTAQSPLRILTIEDREKLPYTHGVVSEVIRWHPATNIVARYTGEDEIIGEYMIPRGTAIIGNLWSMLHDPERYPNPETFWPERYSGEKPSPDPATFAFGFGRRVCPGVHIAQQSLWLAISNILANLTIEKTRAADGSEIIPKEEYTRDVLSHPEPFECAVNIRSAASQVLIDEVEL